MAGVSRRGSPRIHAPGKPGCSAGRLSGPWHRRGRRCQDSAPVRPLERSTGERGHLRVIRSKAGQEGEAAGNGFSGVLRHPPHPETRSQGFPQPRICRFWAISAVLRRFCLGRSVWYRQAAKTPETGGEPISGGGFSRLAPAVFRKSAAEYVPENPHPGHCRSG